jgi:hypothetical protein
VKIACSSIISSSRFGNLGYAVIDILIVCFRDGLFNFGLMSREQKALNLFLAHVHWPQRPSCYEQAQKELS